jgi:hypothetical protein
VNGFHRGPGGIKLLALAGVVWGCISGATYLMHRAADNWAYIPAIVIGGGVLLAVLLFKLIGPLS